MKCQKCGNEFEGKFCPQCGTPVDPPMQSQPVQQYQQPQQPVQQAPMYQQPIYTAPQKKNSGCLKVGLIVLGVIVAIGIISAIVNGINSSKPTAVSQVSKSAEASKGASQAAPDKKTSSASQPTVFGINQTVKKDKVELTVTKVEKSKGGEYDKPKSGMEFVIVTVKYKNASTSDKISYNPFDFKIKNSKGQITSETFTTVNQDKALASGELAPGGEIEGSIAFEQPKDDTGLILQYTGNLFKSDAEIEFKLN